MGEGADTGVHMVGSLDWVPAEERLDLLAAPVAAILPTLSDVRVAEIDPALADTAEFCEHYGIGLDISANCVIVAGKRGETVRYAACNVLATHRVDVNGAVRRHLNARRASFAPMDQATSLTGMEYGGIAPLGVPADWSVLVDQAVAAEPYVVIGSGLRGSKLLVPGKLLAGLPNAEVIALAL